MDNLGNFWQAFLEGMRGKIDPIYFENYFVPARFHSFYDDTIVISVPTDTIKNRIGEGFMDQICDTIHEILGRDLEVQIVSGSGDDIEFLDKSGIQSGALAQLNPKNTFEAFIVGKSNEFAHAVALGVAKNPGRVYNPLFIYGGVGLGKTHLMQAIGRYSLENPKTKDLKVIYLPAAQFTDEFIDSIRDRTQNAFREKYRQVDVLLLDDIQFLAGKDRTQEEFFHTFNEIFRQNKQIVITSDCPPSRLEKMEDRLVNRFEMGLVADIQKPDLELRMAILRNEAKQKRIDIADDVIEFIATHVSSNIRQLEGAFIRVVANASLNGSAISIDFVKHVLRDLMFESQKEITADLIKRVIAEEYGVTVKDLESKQRKRTLSHPRQVAMYLCRELTDMPLAAVGESFGGKDHSTIIYAENKVKESIENDQAFRGQVDKLIRKIKT